MTTPQQINSTDSGQTCGTCANWARLTDERMDEHGQCAKRSIGYYSHQSNVCTFNPVLWRKA